MLDHLSLGTRDLARAARFYDAALGALGVRRVWSFDDAIGYGVRDGEDELALKLRPEVIVPVGGFHLAFTARSREEVDAFHAAALANGGTDRGAPGLRPQYGNGYYAAFVVDPDGHWLEAVHHER